MTRIAVVSDSHGGRFHLERFLEYCKLDGIDRVYHLGDITDDARWLQKRLEIPLVGVAGNCDLRGAREALETVEGKRILLVHGDKYGVKYGCEALAEYAQTRMADVALFGHTHRSHTSCVGKIVMVNPGALKDGSMCLLEVTPEDVIPRVMDIDEWFATRD